VAVASPIGAEVGVEVEVGIGICIDVGAASPVVVVVAVSTTEFPTSPSLPHPLPNNPVATVAATTITKVASDCVRMTHRRSLLGWMLGSGRPWGRVRQREQGRHCPALLTLCEIHPSPKRNLPDRPMRRPHQGAVMPFHTLRRLTTGGDPSLAANDFIDPTRWHSDRNSDLVLGDSSRFIQRSWPLPYTSPHDPQS
jgi:hypothetical protein